MARREGEGIYRRVAVRMHADEKVRRLTKPPPCGGALWWHLLAGEQTGIIPGLFKIGEAAFAEQLEWPLEGFRKAFEEVEAQGLVKADWKARLVWVPNAIRHNIPASPNVVIGWRDAWDLLPECELKNEAHEYISAFLKGYSEPYLKAFDKACPKQDGKASANQEQEQEQDQEKKKEPPAAEKPASAAEPLVLKPDEPKKPKAEPKEATDEQKACRRAIAENIDRLQKQFAGGHPFAWSAAERAGVVTLANLGGGSDPTEGLKLIATFVERMALDAFYAKNFRPSYIASQVNALRVPLAGRNGTGPPRPGASIAASTRDEFEREARAEAERRARQ